MPKMRDPQPEHFRHYTEISEPMRESGIVGSWYWDVPGDRLYADTTFARMFSVDAARAERGAPVKDFVAGIHPADQGRVSRAIGAAVRAAEDFSSDYRLIGPEGVVRWISANARCYRSADGGADHYVGVAIDVTRHKQRERGGHLGEIADRAMEASKIAGDNSEGVIQHMLNMALLEVGLRLAGQPGQDASEAFRKLN